MSLRNIWIAKYALREKKILIYAIGGGKGHLQRALNIAENLKNVTIMHQHTFSHEEHTIISPKSEDVFFWSEHFLHHQIQDFDCFIVDTFPTGIGEEITQDLLNRVSLRFLIARYLKEETLPCYSKALSWYSHILLPYTSDLCEWEYPPSQNYIGHLTRTIKIDTTQNVCMVVIGDINKIPRMWRHIFPTDTVFIDRYFYSLPQAHGYLCIGAGYNIFWELHALKIKAMHIPLHKRYDDQFLRAGRWNRIIHSKQQLLTFITSCKKKGSKKKLPKKNMKRYILE
jgi:hypothetical protein